MALKQTLFPISIVIISIVIRIIIMMITNQVKEVVLLHPPLLTYFLTWIEWKKEWHGKPILSKTKSVKIILLQVFDVGVFCNFIYNAYTDVNGDDDHECVLVDGRLYLCVFKYVFENGRINVQHIAIKIRLMTPFRPFTPIVKSLDPFAENWTGDNWANAQTVETMAKKRSAKSIVF